MIDEFFEGKPLAAQCTVICRKIRITLNPGDFPILNVYQHAASSMTAPAVAVYYLLPIRFTHFTSSSCVYRVINIQD
jgi:hypothetical protein